MCGRYYIDDDTAREIEKLVNEIGEKLARKGDIKPTNDTLVLHKEQTALAASNMAWGFPGFEKQKLMINARSESVMEKRTFKDSFLSRRCIVPASGYYEWDKDRNKVRFEKADKGILFMAGVWKPFEENNRFVILTTTANDSVVTVHDRMPLILEQDEWENWIFEDSFSEYAIHKVPTELRSIRTYNQLSLFDE